MGPRRLRTSLAAGISAATLLTTGCGGSGSASTAGAHRADPLLALARCMRAHGVSHFPDPAPGGGLVLPNGMDVNAPAFQAAQHACGKLLGPGGLGGRPSAADRLAMLKLARCMRAHGVPSFPDPTSTPPATPPANGLAIGRGGLFLVVSDPHGPAFKHAAGVCGFPRFH